MKNLKISFEIKNMLLRSVAERGGEDSFVIEASSGVLSVFVKYDADPRPLVLRGSVAVGDTVEAILMPHRIELYVNGKLCDEEWPAGKCLFDPEDAFEPNIGITFAEYEEKRESQPDVLYTFENAEGWRPEGTFVGDCMPYVKGGEYHVLYLKDRHHHCSKWGYGGHQWEHISTKDFKVWSVVIKSVTSSDLARIGLILRNGSLLEPPCSRPSLRGSLRRSLPLSRMLSNRATFVISPALPRSGVSSMAIFLTISS